ncbi:MAG: hypothetical protein I8H77_16435 [Comamonadaceae bacterium]|nr:hypothetical protein [Comamonadaceae bacterium]
MAISLLASCGGSDVDVGGDRGIRVQKYAAAANRQHHSQTLEALPSRQRHHPGLLGGATSSYPSTVRKHGRVIDVIQAWPRNHAELMVTYVIYGFLSPDFFQTGSIPASGSATTEIWRYSPGGGGTWCPIITAGLGFSTAGVQALPAVNDPLSSTVDIRFISGSADGVVGRVEFRDTNPLASNCDNVAEDIQLLPNKTSFYSMIQPAESIGSVEKFKLVDIDEGKIPSSSKKYTGYQYLFSWGLPACAGSWAIGKDGKCNTFGVSPLRSLLLKNGEPVQAATHVFQDPHGNRGSYFDVNTLTDFDAQAKANAKGGIDFSYAAGFLKTTTDSTHSDRLRIGKTSIGALTDAIGEPAWIDSLDQSLVGAHAIPLQVLVSPSSADLVYVAYHGLTAPDKAQVLCDVSARNCKTLNPLTNNRAFPALESKFSSIRSFMADDSAVTQAFNPRDYVLRSIPHFINVPIPVIDNQALPSNSTNAYASAGGTQMLFDQNMLFQYRPGNPDTSFSSITAMAIGQFENVAVLNASKSQAVVHQLFQFNDYGGYDQDKTQHQDTHGGIGYCAFPVNADGSLNMAACGTPRSKQTGGVGSAYSLATQIAKGGSYMTSPSMIRYSVSPNGTVQVTYVSKAGAISMIDASESTTDWSGPNAWTTISGGQAAECNAVLLKPAMPDPIPPDNFWDSLKHKAVEGTASYLVKSAVGGSVGPVAAFAAGKGVDYLFSMGERAALEKREAEQYEAWTKVYDATQLQTKCRI